VNKWLNQQPTWRFAVMFAGSDLVVLLVALGIEWLVTNGRVNLSFFAGYTPVVVVLTTAGAVYNRRHGYRQRTETERPREQ
jgi:hypothetical protein